MQSPRTTEAEVSADPVCEFYTRHPYPPPVENLDRARDEWRDANRHRAEHHLLWPDRPYRANLDILVAGCGTWQAAKYAVCRPAARVVGIDISTTSLLYTERLKHRYQLANLETRQLRIEDAEALDRRFDLIVCTGVLHHLGDPDGGLRALRSVLKADGAMHLMVYGRYGRVGIDMLQEYCRRLGMGSSREEIDDLVAALGTLSPHHPAAALLRGARDSGDRDALADALLNPRDRSYSVPEFFDFVERNGFVVGRWQLQAPYLPRCGAIAATGHAARLAALREREQYAAMELWRGTIAHHSAVIYRNETRPFHPFDGEHWPRYVPLRLPGTVCVRERLPAGAAAVVLNRGHLHHDLIVPLDDEELRMYEAVDGRRTIAAIAEMMAVAGRDGTLPRARTLFEKLWSYDQVTFDVSSTGARGVYLGGSGTEVQ